jgi:hypothetical protein
MKTDKPTSAHDKSFQERRFAAMAKLNRQIVQRNLTYTDTNPHTYNPTIIQVDEEVARLVNQPIGSNVSYWELRRVMASRFLLTRVLASGGGRGEGA